MSKIIRVMVTAVLSMVPLLAVAQPGRGPALQNQDLSAFAPGRGPDVDRGPHGGLIGPEGNVYFVAVTAGTSGSAATYALKAIPPTATPQFLWTVTLAGAPQEIEPGQGTVYLVLRPATGATSSKVSYLSSTTGQEVRSVDIAGIIRELSVHTVGGVEFLYVNWSDVRVAGSTTAPAAHLSIYGAAGVKIKQVDF